jgi:hypothetical protein
MPAGMAREAAAEGLMLAALVYRAVVAMVMLAFSCG